jgi:predicted AAA+ superfamily ATPase
MDQDPLERIAAALERLIPATSGPADLGSADAFIWQAPSQSLRPLVNVSLIPLELLKGIESARDQLQENTRQFANGLPANNALLWGARGMGKSSLIKAVHGEIVAEAPGTLALVEIHRDDIAGLGDLMGILAGSDRRIIVFCDDLSFDGGTEYQSLKGALDGGIEGRPRNVVIYATSNRRHMMPRDMIENEQSTAITPGETVEEKVSLSDRFGLWLGFHATSQEDFFSMIEAYADHFGLDVPVDELHGAAIEWSMTRGARSGRVAWQFIQDLAGKLGKTLD